MDIAKLHAEGRKFRTVDEKWPVRIICTDRAEARSIVYLVHGEAAEHVLTCANDSTRWIEPIPIEREGWVVMSGGTLDPYIHPSKEDAMDHANDWDTVARITWQE